MKVFTLKMLVSRFKALVFTRAICSKTFIWLPFTGGISAYAVILPKPHGAINSFTTTSGRMMGLS
jgi:hypothetical protein